MMTPIFDSPSSKRTWIFYMSTSVYIIEIFLCAVWLFKEASLIVWLDFLPRLPPATRRHNEHVNGIILIRVTDTESDVVERSNTTAAQVKCGPINGNRRESRRTPGNERHVTSVLSILLCCFSSQSSHGWMMWIWPEENNINSYILYFL